MPANNQLIKVLKESHTSVNISALYNHTIGPKDSENEIS